ncbi:MAG: V-type ATPase subunit [Candidatus Hydrogenedentes bacterium]|nr:V-type ATPase subunit [Candidatus Hydrogenedentota bacterium]
MIAISEHQPAWGFACGRISVLEGKLLSHEFFLGLLSQTRIEDMLRQLQDTPLRDHVTSGAAWNDWSAIIDAYFHDEVVSIRNDCPSPHIANLFLLQRDYLNLKRAILRRSDFPFAPGAVSAQELAQIAAGDLGSVESPTKESVQEVWERSQAENFDAQLDLLMDGVFLRHLLAIATAADVELVTESIREYVLVRAMLALWRGLEQGVPVSEFRQCVLPLDGVGETVERLIEAGAAENWPAVLPFAIADRLREALEMPKTERIQHFDLASANALTTLASLGRYQVAGPERVFSYLSALDADVYNLKLAVCGRLSRIDSELLRRRLRAYHV